LKKAPPSPEYKFRISPLNQISFSRKKKPKAIPVTGSGDTYGCETSRLPHFLDNQLTYGGEAVNLTAALYTPGRFLVLISVSG
jgi:hypothetical protein